MTYAKLGTDGQKETYRIRKVRVTPIVTLHATTIHLPFLVPHPQPDLLMNQEFQEVFGTAKKARAILDNMWAAMTDVEIAIGEVEADSSNLEAATVRAPEVLWTMYRTALKNGRRRERLAVKVLALGAQIFAGLQRMEELPDMSPEAELLTESVSMCFRNSSNLTMMYLMFPGCSVHRYFKG